MGQIIFFAFRIVFAHLNDLKRRHVHQKFAHKLPIVKHLFFSRAIRIIGVFKSFLVNVIILTTPKPFVPNPLQEFFTFGCSYWAQPRFVITSAHVRFLLLELNKAGGNDRIRTCGGLLAPDSLAMSCLKPDSATFPKLVGFIGFEPMTLWM